MRTQTNQTNQDKHQTETANTLVTDKKRGPTALGRTLVEKEVGEGSGGRGGHVKDEQEGGEVRATSVRKKEQEGQRPASTGYFL